MSNAKIAAPVIVFCWCCAAHAAAADDAPAKSRISFDPAADFVAFNPDYKQLKRKYRGEMNALRDRFNELEASGREMSCSRQVLLEIRWLLHYTADVASMNHQVWLATVPEPATGGALAALSALACLGRRRPR